MSEEIHRQAAGGIYIGSTSVQDIIFQMIVASTLGSQS